MSKHMVAEVYGGARWRHRSFCRTSEAQRRVVREHAGKIDPAAAAILAGLPAWIERRSGRNSGGEWSDC